MLSLLKLGHICPVYNLASQADDRHGRMKKTMHVGIQMFIITLLIMVSLDHVIYPLTCLANHHLWRADTHVEPIRGQSP